MRSGIGARRLSPCCLALVTVSQMAEDLTDRQAAEASGTRSLGNTRWALIWPTTVSTFRCSLSSGPGWPGRVWMRSCWTLLVRLVDRGLVVAGASCAPIPPM